MSAKEPITMQKVVMADPTLTEIQRELMQKENFAQVQKYRTKFKSRTGMFGAGLIGLVGGIYAYTIYTMSRDDFMSDIDSEVQKRLDE